MDELKTLVWNGKIPVVFELAVEEFSDIELKDFIPLYQMIPRISYLALFVEQIAQHYQNELEYHPSFGSASSETISSPTLSPHRNSLFTNNTNLEKIRQFVENHIWFSHKDQPLKWHYSFGLLYDIFNHDDCLPWRITIHFDNYPSEILLSPPVNRQSMEIIFMSLVKEADWLKHRGSVMEKLLPRDHKQLWSSLCQNKYDKFWAINKKLMTAEKFLPKKKSASLDSLPDSDSSEVTKQEEAEDILGFRHIPFKVYWLESAPNESQVNVIQKLVKPFNLDGNNPEKLIPNDVRSLILSSCPPSVEGEIDKLLQEYVFLIHGIECKLEAHLQWASETFSYPDNFLHFVARPRTKNNSESAH